MKILIIKLGALGDVINTFPLVVNIKKYFNAEIDWLVAPLSYPLVANHPCVDNAILFDKKKIIDSLPSALGKIREKQYDITLDLQRILKSALFTMAARTSWRVGFNRERCKEVTWLFPFDRIPPSNPKAHMLNQYLEFAEHINIPLSEVSWMIPRTFKKTFNLPDRYIVLNIGASRPVKQWRLNNFADLADKLNEKFHLQAVLTGGPEDVEGGKKIHDKTNADIIDLTGKTSIPQLVEVIANARCVISCDTGAMHLAAALGIDLIALFGPTDPRRTGPFRGVVIQKKLPCTPCNRKKCKNPRCMDDITPQEVFCSLGSLLL
ncbi:heptosyltransferase-1 [Desulfocicer vacuolatum DSM 3385]|uniref:Heptosyltransferase-1 n=1 Tax=Desulfocicer vacuolatum DSM 3385 TaxID=1121400 RepID=A0A1W1ZBZ2_9BACT|nr:glycosyltransferase family 9 protein [Desulfocicer vacuolatum]SMC45792.1 heptosyltransferase-1 [Desulfocicer vacuolatum DSM 3385]